MDFYDLLFAKKLSGGGGGSSVDVESLSVTANGTYTAPEGKAYSPVNVNVQTPQEAEVKDVNFFDYEGTCLYSYTVDEWANVNALPENPSHDDLVAQGWNWTKAQIDEQLRDVGGSVIVGQMYDTLSGASEINFTLDKRLSPYLCLAINGSVIVDWGDGTSTEISGNSLTTKINTQHTYSMSGEYTISITKNSGSYAFYGGSSTGNGSMCVLNNGSTYVNNVRENYPGSINYIRVGSSATGVTQCAFYNCSGLKYVTFAENIRFDTTQIIGYSSLLRFVQIPSGNSTAPSITYCYGLNYLSVPYGVTNAPYATNANILKITIPKTVSAYAQSALSASYSLKSIAFPGTLETMSNIYASSCFSIKEIIYNDGLKRLGKAVYGAQAIETLTLPSSLTTIDAQAFNNYYSMKEYHFKSVTPPSLANSNAFTGIPSDCIIYVPYSADHSILNAYKTATNWSTYASYMQEEPQ